MSPNCGRKVGSLSLTSSAPSFALAVELSIELIVDPALSFGIEAFSNAAADDPTIKPITKKQAMQSGVLKGCCERVIPYIVRNALFCQGKSVS